MVFRIRKRNSLKKVKSANRVDSAGSVILQPRLHDASDANATISLTRRGSEKSGERSKRVGSLLKRCFSLPGRSLTKESKEVLQPSEPIALVKLDPVSLVDVEVSIGSESVKSFCNSPTIEDYYSALSTLGDIFVCGQDNIDDDISSRLFQIEKLNAHAPAVIPTNSVSASEQLVECIPQESRVCGNWIKSFKESTPAPGPADKVISAGFAVQRVRNKLCQFNFSETEDELMLEIIVPVMGMAPWIETYKKDGSLCKFKNRRDYRSGTAFGQAMVLSNGRIMLRVWNLGSSPEVMWEEIIEFSENTLKLEHHAYRLDGTKTGTQSSVLYRCS